ncbi:iron-siderophore ABC transporter substrate-binding protein [Pelagovum pacificum]|uniref:Iron-siderophore ABC transporter substrate-binding protein n=1 Tax=Pelagovum pacificum TaxID=2588711 RepID=A0A5C5GGI3_9RHOB|nr:iron-siderophore ABC transporter substrate-binding protein [Pelagovum pacificum]QQA44232.1 iron-siderophore ABC transporter substrate-binding protein [Pelagovum pacificum]TNY32646.1 iron-siderophore ABC transporter substrate-binding protein [Pelagovum pacificum]
MRALVTALIALAAGPALAQDFPLTIEHKFGQSVIEAAPERVATVDYNGADNLLALGLQPVVVRDWFGDQPRAVWPWADALLDETPEILSGELNFEQIAAAEPDLITAVWSGITPEDYERLSQIAPVVAVPEGTADYALGWKDQALIVGRAVGRADEAEAQVVAIEDRIAAMRDAHPEWAGKTTTLATYWDGQPGIYLRDDSRVLLLSELGFANNPVVEELSDDMNFYADVSEERIEAFDSDLLLWFADAYLDEMQDIAFRPALDAVQEGRELFLGRQMTSAFSHTSLLSLPYLFDTLEPRLEAAFDGGIPEADRITE